MTSELKYIIVKCFIVIIIILVYMIIVNYGSSSSSSSSSSSNSIETFEEQIEKEKYNYLKLKETYIDSKDTSLELLYANYYGEELQQNVWEDKTFEQCIDTCNKLDNCIGFSRDLVLDIEPAKCHPITSLKKCYSNRKGNDKQMSKALKYNSYIKSNVPNVINHCIGDNDLTLNRIIYIKSYSKPNEYIGNNGDSRVTMIDKNTSEFNIKCGFRIEIGKDGVGTVSFLHLKSYQYLYRNSDNTLVFKDINSNNTKTEDKQRASFNIYDGLSSGIMFKALPIEGETTDKYIMLDNSYLKLEKISNSSSHSSSNSSSNSNSNSSKSKKSSNTSNNKSKELSTFYIIDTIIDSKIITDKNNINNTNTNVTQNTSTIPSITKEQRQEMTTSKLSSISDTNEKFADTNTSKDNDTKKNKLVLDKTTDISIYNDLFNSNNVNLPDYLEDNYLSKASKDKYVTISKKNNEGKLNKLLSNSLTKNQDEFYYINELNKEIEKEIANKNLDLNAKNDKIINNLDKLRITDLSQDYFYLQSLTENPKPT